jgi:hypothetical protein
MFSFFFFFLSLPDSFSLLPAFAQKQGSRTDVDMASPTTNKPLEKRYAELVEKTIAAIATEDPPPTENNGSSVQRSLPKLPRYQPPPPSPPPPSQPSARHMVCRMFFPTSGHMGFDTVKLYETRLRLCDSVQEIMDEYHTDECAVT